MSNSMPANPHQAVLHRLHELHTAVTQDGLSDDLSDQLSVISDHMTKLRTLLSNSATADSTFCVEENCAPHGFVARLVRQFDDETVLVVRSDWNTPGIDPEILAYDSLGQGYARVDFSYVDVDRDTGENVWIVQDSRYVSN